MATEWRNRIVRFAEVAPDQLLANPKNWRVHPKHQQDALTGVIREVGYVDPVLVQDGTDLVIDGHLRVSLALRDGVKAIPVQYVDLDDVEAELVLATFDPITALATADRDQLDALLRTVTTGEAAVQQLLADVAEQEGVVDLGGGVVEDDGPLPDPPADPVTKPGDLWLLGEHRLLCGDSTIAGDVERLLAGAEPRLMVTDPPYGVEYDANWRNEAAAKGLISHAAVRVGKVANDNRIDWFDAWSLFPGDVVYCWHADRHASSVQKSLESAGFEIRSQVIWAKSRFAISRGHYHWQHEPCWYGVRIGATAGWVGDRSQTTLWTIELDQNVVGGHSTQKPLECMARPIRNHEGDVYDPFIGSGTTLVACEQLGRRCYGMEIEPAYCDVIVQRWERLTGKTAVLERSAVAVAD